MKMSQVVAALLTMIPSVSCLQAAFRLILTFLIVKEPKPMLPINRTAVMEALAARPTVRNAVLRSNDRAVNLSRPSNIEAMLGQMVGDISNPACEHCSRSRPSGLWTSCVIVEGFFGGSCANCHYNNMAPRCSLRKLQAILNQSKPRTDISGL